MHFIQDGKVNSNVFIKISPFPHRVFKNTSLTVSTFYACTIFVFQLLSMQDGHWFIVEVKKALWILYLVNLNQIFNGLMLSTHDFDAFLCVLPSLHHK